MVHMSLEYTLLNVKNIFHYKKINIDFKFIQVHLHETASNIKKHKAN